MKIQELQPAYLLHAKSYKESSLLTEFFTRDHGIISAIVRGANRPRSRWARLVNPFIPLVITWQGRTNLYTITNLEVNGKITSLTGRKLISGLYINELLIRLCKQADPHVALFDSYQCVVQQLAQTSDEQPILRLFEKQLLREIGYELPLTQNSLTGEVVTADQYYIFKPELGPQRITSNLVTCEPEDFGVAPGAVSDSALMNNAVVYQGASLLALANEEFTNKQQLMDAKRLMRQVLAIYLGDKPLATRRMLTFAVTS